MANTGSVLPGIFPGAVSDVWPIFRIIRIWISDVTILAILEVQVLVFEFAKRFNNSISFY